MKPFSYCLCVQSLISTVKPGVSDHLLLTTVFHAWTVLHRNCTGYRDHLPCATSDRLLVYQVPLWTCTQRPKVPCWLAGLKCALKQMHAVNRSDQGDSAGCAACDPVRCALPAGKYSMLRTWQHEYSKTCNGDHFSLSRTHSHSKHLG